MGFASETSENLGGASKSASQTYFNTNICVFSESPFLGHRFFHQKSFPVAGGIAVKSR